MSGSGMDARVVDEIIRTCGGTPDEKLIRLLSLWYHLREGMLSVSKSTFGLAE
jgi:hypothetical protein